MNKKIRIYKKNWINILKKIYNLKIGKYVNKNIKIIDILNVEYCHRFLTNFKLKNNIDYIVLKFFFNYFNLL